MPPAQMHGDTTGGVEWFVSTDGNDAGGDTMRVTKMTNYFSSSPTFTYTSLPVTPYQAAGRGRSARRDLDDVPEHDDHQVQYRNGHAGHGHGIRHRRPMGSSYPKGLYYEVNVSSGTPILLQQGVIDPGSGRLGADAVGGRGHPRQPRLHLDGGVEHRVPLDVGRHPRHDRATSRSYDVGPRRRRSSTSTSGSAITARIVLDPTDGTTFWAANEYIGPMATQRHLEDAHHVVLAAAGGGQRLVLDQRPAGNSLYLQTYTPSDQGGQFPNTASLEIELYDTFGNLVAIGTKLADGRNEALFFNAPVTGQYFIHVFNDPGGAGEYFLSVNTASYPVGRRLRPGLQRPQRQWHPRPGDPGLDNWEVDVFDSNGNFVASQLTAGGGNFDIEGLAPGTYTVDEVLQSGWTQTAPPPPGTFTVTVTAGATVSGLDFGNFQNITISGEKFNDLNGDGTQEPGEPGLPGWTIDLLDATGAIIATTVTDANGDYSFTDVGPGTYTVQEELQPGWIQTDPGASGNLHGHRDQRPGRRAAWSSATSSS